MQLSIMPNTNSCRLLFQKAKRRKARLVAVENLTCERKFHLISSPAKIHVHVNDSNLLFKQIDSLRADVSNSPGFYKCTPERGS